MDVRYAIAFQPKDLSSSVFCLDSDCLNKNEDKPNMYNVILQLFSSQVFPDSKVVCLLISLKEFLF